MPEEADVLLPVPWFANDCTGRALGPHENTLRKTLAAVLLRRAPAQVRPEESMLTAEGTERFMAILPHHDLGGLSLVTTMTRTQVELSWAAIHSLEYHDDLDEAATVASVDRAKGDWVMGLQAALQAELDRRIRVRATFRGDHESPYRMDFDIGVPLRHPLFVLRPVPWTQWFRRNKTVLEGETGLSAPHRLPFRLHPLVYEWTPWRKAPAIAGGNLAHARTG